MSRNGLWSALQTHLQGVDGATLAIESEMYRHAQPSFLKYLGNSIAGAKIQPWCSCTVIRKIASASIAFRIAPPSLR